MSEDKNAHILDPQRINLAEYWRQDWVVNAEAGTTVEQVEDPAYWAHVSAKFKPYDNIEVRAEDGAWIAEFVVLDCSRTWARVYRKNLYKLGAKETVVAPSAKHEVKFKGPQHKHCVIRISDGAIISEGHASAEIAATALRQHEQVIG